MSFVTGWKNEHRRVINVSLSTPLSVSVSVSVSLSLSQGPGQGWGGRANLLEATLWPLGPRELVGPPFYSSVLLGVCLGDLGFESGPGLKDISVQRKQAIPTPVHTQVGLLSSSAQ